MTKLLHTTTMLCALLFIPLSKSQDLKFVHKTFDSLATRDSISPDDIAKLKPHLDSKPTGQQKPLKQSGKVGRRKMVKGTTEWKTDDWQVAIIQDKEFFCGGSLITSQWILTAAQCAYQRTKFEVILGSQSPTVFTDGRVLFATNKKIVHSDYKPETLYSDIALIQLPVEITSLPSDHINTIRLPKIADATKSLENSVVEASGWKNGSLDAPSFYSFPMTVIANSECAAIFGKSSITSSNLCAQPTTANLNTFCSGDIGSPLVLKEKGSNKYTQVGILSFRATDCISQSSLMPTCFTRVSSFLGWISEYANVAID